MGESKTLPAFVSARLDDLEAEAHREIEWEQRHPLPDLTGASILVAPVAARPEFVLADVESKRAIVALHAPRDGGCWECDEYGSVATGGPLCLTLRLLAQPYAAHPDFLQEWVTP